MAKGRKKSEKKQPFDMKAVRAEVVRVAKQLNIWPAYAPRYGAFFKNRKPGTPTPLTILRHAGFEPSADGWVEWLKSEGFEPEAKASLYHRRWVIIHENAGRDTGEPVKFIDDSWPEGMPVARVRVRNGVEWCELR